ncbi:MAG: hypothetical protein HN712_00210 [Gemmatimonadetes bacterium]|nr:hypothetical protein [Gemmatimonadota bacterium]
MKRVALLLALWVTAVHGVEPTTVYHGRLADFSGGEGEHVTLHADGGLSLGPALIQDIDTMAERVWAVATDGDRLYVATGDQGQVLIIQSGRIQQTVSIDGGAPMALAVGASGLYIGTGSGGRLLRHLPSGVTEELLTTTSQYVWDLAIDGDGVLIACGAEARVLRWRRNGEVDTLLHKPIDGHVRTLAHRQDHWLAGTTASATGDESAGHGRVYALDGEGGARLLLETELEEVADLAVVGDVTFVAAMTVPDKGQPTATLLRLNADGASYPIWSGTGIWAGLVRDGEDVVAITREPTRVMRLPGRGQTEAPSGAILARTDSISPSAVAWQAGSLLLGDSQSGNLWRLQASAASSGRFDAPVYDARQVATWGSLAWRGQGHVSSQTRSGNSDEPDDTWSDWSAPQTSGEAVSSPAARYLQYRLTLEDDDELPAHVEGVWFRLRQANLPPRIDEVITFPYRGGAGALQNPDQIPLPGPQRNYTNGPPQRKSLRVLRWKASDANGDPLQFDIYLRGTGQKTWKLIGENVERVKTVVWDTELMPEGITSLKLVASDASSNPAGTALEDSYTTPPFIIDNTPPLVELRQRQEGGQTIIEAGLTDAVSALRGARFSLDYDEATTRLGATDGLFDGSREALQFVLPAMPAGEHVVTVQAWDELENVGVAQILVEIQP